MIYKESSLNFNFDENRWTHLLEFDKIKDFQKAQEALPGTKGVDFSGILENNALVFIEAKNFRGHRIETKPRIENGEDPLWLETAQKMRDAIAVSIGSARYSTHKKEDWKAYLRYLRREHKIIHFVLWLEEDLPPADYQSKKKWGKNETQLKRQLKKSLLWLSARVDIASIANNPFPHALTVTFQSS